MIAEQLQGVLNEPFLGASSDQIIKNVVSQKRPVLLMLSTTLCNNLKILRDAFRGERLEDGMEVERTSSSARCVH